MVNKSQTFIKLTTSAKLKKYTEDERQNHCDHWRKSGLSMSDYCRQSGLAVSTLSKWLSGAGHKEITKPPLLETPAITSSQTYPGIEIILVSGIQLRFTRASIAEIVRFIKALESCS